MSLLLFASGPLAKHSSAGGLSEMRHKDRNKKQEYQVAARYSLTRILIWLDYQKTSHLLQGFLCLPHLRQRGQPINRSESDMLQEPHNDSVTPFDNLVNGHWQR